MHILESSLKGKQQKRHSLQKGEKTQHVCGCVIAPIDSYENNFKGRFYYSGPGTHTMKQSFLVYNCKMAYIISIPSVSSKPLILLHCCELPSVTGVPQAKIYFKWRAWACYRQGFEHFPLESNMGCPPCKPGFGELFWANTRIRSSSLCTCWLSSRAHEDVH